ncbi:anti-sigma factor antagonist [Edwardsiella ictaluri]|uniref:STAS domain protein n=2 Tax=Edwardsiella ictaluri TaxID=67780 RepID=C5B8U3_EDWI9|nr:STAS domain-containing protein [Edwardsiella ictaluri]ACR70146.1 STAS domain protein [Edwardsiella ictaluri 93-146]AVZ82962.1 anti-sigma factor antagonist [Edwardsiella ictaluri]EKS7763993.1 STAS domain-containing protein [Edwardsiella ictaluri]EKS7770773.1 STAS domain-containing protein [Edwardsiella ictaluri]EKS7773917.1 STAS domain-containing protein [Edwardsiella ictaluri]
MNLAVEKVDDLTMVSPLIRRLDASVVGVFRQNIVTLAVQGHYRLLLGFSQVDFIDRRCLGALLSRLRLLNHRCDLLLCGLSEHILGMFCIIRMDRAFHIGTDRQQMLVLHGVWGGSP